MGESKSSEFNDFNESGDARDSRSNSSAVSERAIVFGWFNIGSLSVSDIELCFLVEYFKMIRTYPKPESFVSIWSIPVIESIIPRDISNKLSISS